VNKTSIGWTDWTWNTTVGCTHVSAGCEHCYAEQIALRFGHSKHPWIKPYETENVRVKPEKLREPFALKQPARVFVDSMSDLFHPLIPAEHIAKVFAVMAATPHLTFQILTKRPERMRALVGSVEFQGSVRAEFNGWVWMARDGVPGWPGWPLPNCWLGTSVEDERVTERIGHLIATPAAVRFLSIEPMIGPVDLEHWLWQQDGHGWGEYGYLPVVKPSGDLHWVICGGESGPNRRPMEIEWAADLALQCRGAGVAFWMKQDSGFRPEQQGRIPDELWKRKDFPAVATATARQEAML